MASVYPKILKPWRGFPNVNGVHAISLSINQSPAAQDVYGNPGRTGVVVTRDKAVHIGTLPKGALILPATVIVSVAFSTSVTLKVGSAPAAVGGASTEDVIATATIAPQATGYKPNVTMGALANTRLAADTPIFLAPEGAAVAAGAMDLVIPFYIHKD